MNTDDFKAIQASNPDAVRVWYGRMLDLNKGQLLETLIIHMDREFFSGLVLQINRDIEDSRTEEGVDDDE
tara:strand:+ start:3045 stop:3254 length:210 start_codon:yes stop_codon:yes gene_type:complete